jgi:hypothetical protein
MPVFPAPVDKGSDVSDIFVNRRTFCFLTSIKYELVKGILRYLFRVTPPNKSFEVPEGDIHVVGKASSVIVYI